MMIKGNIIVSLIASCLILAGCLPLQAQLVMNWQNCQNQTGYDIYAYDICRQHNDFLIAAYKIVNNSYDYVLIKTTDEGIFDTEYNYGGSHADLIERIIPIKNGAYYLVGTSKSVDGDVTYNPYPGSDNYWIVKIDSLGNKIWDKVVGGTALEDILDATVTIDGGVVAMGYSYSIDGDISHPYGAFDMWTVKLDSAGNKCWEFSLGSSEFEYGYGIIATSDSGYLLMGYGEHGNDGNITCSETTTSKGLLAKIDKNGNKLWDICYGGTNNYTNNSTVLTTAMETDDGYIIGGATNCDNGDMDGSGYHYGFDNDVPTYDIWLCKTDFSGNILWQKCYGGSGWDFVRSIRKDKQGNLLLFGETQSFDGDVVGNHSINEGNPDIWIFKVNIENGQLIWQQCFGGNGREDLEHGVVQKNDSTWVIAATAKGPPTGSITCSPPDPQEYMDYYIWTFEVTDTNLYVSSSKPEAVQVGIKPNPVKEWVEVDYTLPPASEQAVLTITDLTGRILITQSLTGNKGRKSIDVSQLSSGTYISTIRAGNNQHSSKLCVFR